MSNPGRNEGVRVLADFVCEAIHAAAVPRADEHRGRNEGLLVLEELSLEASAMAPTAAASEAPAGTNPSIASTLDNTLKAEAGRVAALLSTADDPVGAAGRFQKWLLAELNSMLGR